VRLRKPAVGGGFGARQQLHAQHVAALMSKKLGRPVRLSYTREEDLYSVARHASEVELRLGAGRDGTMKLFDARYRLNAGPYTTHSPTVVAAAARKLQYRVPNYFFEGISVFTNHITGGAFRGYGNTQLTFGREILMDRLAEQLGLDPVEFRLMNHVQVGECFPCASIPVSSSGIEACARRCQAIQREIDQAAPLLDNGEVRQAWGIAFSCHGSGPSSKEGLSSAVLLLNDDATVNLLVGSSDIGQGSETMESQIAAECLGVPLSSIRITAADTLLTPYDTGTFGSSQTFLCGNAVARACADLKHKLLAQLRIICPGCEIEEREHRYLVRGGGEERTLTFQEAVRMCLFDAKGGVIIGSWDLQGRCLSQSVFRVLCKGGVPQRAQRHSPAGHHRGGGRGHPHQPHDRGGTAGGRHRPGRGLRAV
jgi:CO/xanthine dehydrogenase Mo-binding subunit